MSLKKSWRDLEAIIFNEKISVEKIKGIAALLGYQIGPFHQGKHVFIPTEGTVTSIVLHMTYEERVEFVSWLEIILEKENV